MLAVDLSNVQWCKSSYSGGNGTCVEVGFAPAAVAVRDTKDRAGGALAVPVEEWSTFVAGLKRGAFDRR